MRNPSLSLGWGVMYGCAFLPPLPGQWQILSFVLRLAAFTGGLVGWMRTLAVQTEAKSAAASGFWFGFGSTCSTLWGAFPAFWVVQQSVWFLPCLGGLAALWGVLLGALCWGLFATLAALLPKDAATTFPYRPLGLALCWLLFEWGRSHIPLAFPWNLTVHVFAFENLVPSLMMLQVVRPFGVYFPSALLCLVLASFFAGTSRWLRILVSSLLLGVLIYGGFQLTLPEARIGRSFKVLVVQPNTPQTEKLNRQNAEDVLENLIHQTQAALGALPALPDMVVWPETAVTFFIHKTLPSALYDKLPLDRLTLVFGADRVASLTPHEELIWHNSLFFLSPQDSHESRVHIYDKKRLLPFGEYVPFRQFPLLKKIVEGVDCTPGTSESLVSLPGLPDVFVKICSEGMFSWGRPQATWALQVLNDGWFAAPLAWQHFAVDRVRAVEAGLPFIRVGNTGITALLDSHGRILQRLPYGHSASDVFEVR